MDAIEAGLTAGALHPNATNVAWRGRSSLSTTTPIAAAAAEAAFDSVFKEHAMPDEIPEAGRSSDDEVYLPGMMQELGLVATTSDGRRMIDQGGVRIDGIALSPRIYTYARADVENMVLQVGKRRFVRPVAAVQ